MDSAEQIDYQHGRIERRCLWALPLYDDFIRWKGAATMLRLERITTYKSTGKITRELDYALTSLSLDQVSAQQLLTFWRQHWHLENKSHYVRDVVLGEEASRIRKNRAPQFMAACRNTLLTLLRSTGFSHLPDTLHTLTANPYRALGLLIRL